MKYADLKDYIKNQMRISHIYQPLLIKSLIDAGGSATVRQLAQQFLFKDESQLVYYENRIKVMPVPVLKKHGIIKWEKDLISLTAKGLTFTERAELKALCEEKVQQLAARRGMGNWDYRHIPHDSVEGCRFCLDNITDRIVEEFETVTAIADGYPVTKGHLLIVPKRHITDYFSLSQRERNDANELIRFLTGSIKQQDNKVTGFNIGVNCGESAGQTIFHAHIHLIPRRDGDTPDPRGGVRGVIPGKRAY